MFTIVLFNHLPIKHMITSPYVIQTIKDNTHTHARTHTHTHQRPVQVFGESPELDPDAAPIRQEDGEVVLGVPQEAEGETLPLHHWRVFPRAGSFSQTLPLHHWRVFPRAGSFSQTLPLHHWRVFPRAGTFSL